jgi:hypothetical protein
MVSTLQDKASGQKNCIERLDKLGNDIMIYFDMDAEGYRTATKSWKVRF